MGVRMALGAEGGRLGRLVVGRSLVLSLAGVAVGSVLALAAAPALRSLLYGVEAGDPLTFLGTAAVLLAVSTMAAAVPAIRAARVDPVRVLRAD
jgi:ABC-type antimicrobial peptide transport system permease subunit